MDISPALSAAAGGDWIQQLTGLAQASEATSVGTAVLDQVLEVQEQLAAQMLQTLGVGGGVDLFV